MFLEPQIIKDHYFDIETSQGTECIPCLLGYTAAPVMLQCFIPYLEGDLLEDEHVVATPINGYVCRLSAPGYMDCTPWVGFPTLKDAAQYLLDVYFDDFDPTLESEQDALIVEQLEEMAR